jgi:hypothetical protein
LGGEGRRRGLLHHEAEGCRGSRGVPVETNETSAPWSGLRPLGGHRFPRSRASRQPAVGRLAAPA